MCLWNRPDRLEPVLALLGSQRNVAGIDLYLWNNARADHSRYERVLRGHGVSGSLSSVALVKTPFNLGSIARFYWARKLAKAGKAGPIIVIDDDEEFTPDFVSSALAQYEPGTITAWWAFEVGASYWERTPSRVGGAVDHIGPGGMVCDADIFLDTRFFTELPLRYWFLDDLWLTAYAKDRGIPLRKLDAEIEFVLEETNQYPALIGLKQEFYEYLKTRR